MIDEYRKQRTWQARARLVYGATLTVRQREEAFQLGVVALADRSHIVRFHACGVLAYSLREDALPHLQRLLQHPDARTVEDARAAMDAIRARNHHYYRDRAHTNQIFWHVNEGDSIL